MKSRALERSGSGSPDAGSARWTRRVILGGLGTAGASIAMAAFAAVAFGNAANPTSASSTETIDPATGHVTVTVQGTWSWGELAGVTTSPQKDCAGRSGVGWSVDWWGMSNSPSPAAGMGPTSGSLVNAATSKTTAPSPTNGALSVAGTWQVKSGASKGLYFHTSHQYNGFLADLCNNATPTATGPIGSYSATAVYPSLAAVPAKICVNFYDPHGSQGSYSTSAGDNYADQAKDNSITTNSFDPLNVQGNCSTPVLTNLAINVDKNNDANQDGQFNKTETAKTAGQDVTFSVKITNPSSNNVPVVIDSLTDAAPGLTTHAPTCKDSSNNTVIGQTLQPGASVTCTFTEPNYAPATNSLTDTVTVNVHQAGVPANTATGTSTSTVNAPPAKATLAAKILLCSDPTVALPNNGSLVTSGGPTAVPAANNTLGATQVDPGTYTVAATPPTGYHFVVCGPYNGASSQSATLANGDNKELDFYVAPNGSPNISYAKTGPATGIAGSTGDYTITLSNTGTATAAGPTTFVDVLPVGETFNSVRPASDAGMSCTAGPVTGSGQVVTCTYANDLLKNTSASVVIRANFAAGTEGQTLRDCTGNTQNTANVCWNTNILQPNLQITKTGPGTGVPGGSGTYTITVKNIGQGPAQAVSFVDQLPAKESFVSASGDFNCTVNPNDSSKINCVAKSGLLPLATNGTLSVNVLVTYALTSVEGDQLTDCAILPSLDQSCATTVIHTPDLVIQKTGPATGTAGGQGVYTISVKNTGQATANNVTFTDTLPVGESYVSSSSTTVTCSLSANPQVLNCSLNNPLAAGASVSVDVTVAYGANTGGQTLTDCAQLTAGNQSCVPTKIPSTPSITVVKTNDANGDGVFHDTEQANAQGDSVTFKVVVTNTSADPIVIDSVSDVWPGSSALAECPQLIGTTLQSGDAVTCTFTVDNYAPAAGDSLTNTITVNGHQPNTGTPVTATDTSTVTTKVPSSVDLAIVKNADLATVKAGNTLTYTLAVTNVGQSPTTGPVTVTDSVPSGLDLVSVDGGTAWDCSVNGNDITCTYQNGVLNPGDAAPIITVVTTVNDTAVGTVINTGVVDTPGDVNPANNRSTVKTPVIKVLPEKIVKPTTPTTPTVLPFTGDRTGSMLPVGLAAVLAGLLLMVAGRRRRRTE